MDAEEGIPDAPGRLHEVLRDAETRRDTEVEVLALDALALVAAHSQELSAAQTLLDRADQLMPSAQHLIGEADRFDGNRARRLLLPV
jgi:hypothetical protein